MTEKTQHNALAMRRAKLLAVTAIAWIIVIAIGVSKQQLAARAPVTIKLQTEPVHVKLVLDGRKMFNGRHSRTPLTLQVKPGRHTLKIKRKGFVSHVVTVDAGPGDNINMTDVVLEKSGKAKLMEVRVETQDEDIGYLDLDNGLTSGKGTLSAKNVQAGIEHTLRIFPKWPDESHRIDCVFRPKYTEQSDEPYVIRINRVKKRLRPKGCKIIQ